MGVAISIREYFSNTGVEFETVKHRRTECASDSAEASKIPEKHMAKAVVLRNEDGYLLSVIPSSEKVDLNKIRDLIDQRVVLASESEFAALFPDCEKGAVPAVGAAYGLYSIIDDSLDDIDDIYFEGGDHQTLIHISGSQFGELTRKSMHESVCIDDRPSPYSVGFGYFGA